jgi:HlyD family secretion protein
MEHKLPPLKVRIAVLTSVVVLGFIIYFILNFERETKKIEATGLIEAKEVDITTRVNSKVLEIYFDEGMQVKKGDILLKLDDRVVAAQYKAAEINYDNAEKNFNRANELFKSNAISKQAFEQAQANYLMAKANFEQAKMLNEDCKPEAPWDGVVLKKYVEQGELVAQNTPLFTIADLKTVKVTFYVSLKELGKIKSGQKIKVKIDTFKNKIYEGKITFISDKAEFTPKNIQTKQERVKEVFAVQAQVVNENYELKPGMPCDVIVDLN